VDDNIIIVVIAGNHAIGNKDKNGKALPDRPNIDTFPAVIESATLPLIVIGATNNVGKEEKFSQHGPHLTIGAPGYQVRCQSQDPAKTDPFQDSGTSFGESWFSRFCTLGLRKVDRSGHFQVEDKGLACPNGLAKRPMLSDE